MTSRKLTSRALQQRYGVVDKTIDRWVATGVLPEPTRINGNRYWDEEEVEQRDRERSRTRKRQIKSLPTKSEPITGAHS
jgi:predicted DNA-binding transcriptional regulator AlpA